MNATELRNNPLMLDFFRIKESLDIANTNAGGTLLPVDKLIEMSAIELLIRLAPNHIEFTYTGPRNG